MVSLSIDPRYSSDEKNVHAIGDLANKVVVDAIEAAIGSDRQEGAERRLRIEHAQIMRPEDIKRAVNLGGETSFTSGRRY